jgi:eukaryotic-like serine/threonine-protein kinase
MELADGSLRDLLKKRMPVGNVGFPPEDLLRYFREAAEAVDYLHANQMFHGDLKPENILLVDGHARVADFGLAQLVELSRALATRRRWWRSDYLASDLLVHGQFGEQSDRYSLAVSYVELRLNRPLFPSTYLPEKIERDVKRIPDLAPLDPAEQSVLHRALAKDPRRRYRSCVDFIAELEKAQKTKRLAPSQPTKRRHLLVTIVLFLFSFAVMSLLGWYIAIRSAIEP